MKVEVKLLSEKGRAVPRGMLAERRRYTGAFSLQEARSRELGRTSFVATLHSTCEGAQEPLLPPLHDATLIHAADGRLRVRGFEFVDGTQLGQTWEVRVMPC
jgi:hypothetical protein